MEPIRITLSDADTKDERFDRFRLIGWWNQERLKTARVLVIGAGALGNEIIKNLALLGIGNVFIADLDRIENSNLSRSVLYRARDNGASKAETAALAAKDLYPDMNVHGFDGNVVHDLGLGVYRWADLTLGGLDNREARLSINRASYRIGHPWIDGAIERIEGIARVFVPDGPCYECTMNDMDWKLLQKRRSCNLLSKQEMETGKTPTTPTVSAIIAGVQCQEAVKLLHGMESMAGHGWVFQGMTVDSFLVTYQRKNECYSHDPFTRIVSLEESSDLVTVGALLERVRSELGAEAVLECSRDLLEKLTCPTCGAEEPMYCSLSKVRSDKAMCPACGEAHREVHTFYCIRGNEPFLDKTLREIGVPLFDILTARTPADAVGLEIAGDAPAVLGPLFAGDEGEVELT